MAHTFAAASAASTPIVFVTPETWSAQKDELDSAARAQIAASGFEPRAGAHALIVDARGGARVFFVVEDKPGADPFLVGKLVSLLPAGVYAFANRPPGDVRALEQAALGWLLSAYRFTRYRKPSDKAPPRLIAPKGADKARVERMFASVCYARDLINTPANDMGPESLEKAALDTAKLYGARARVTRGAALLKENFPLIHAVGRAAAQEPRLVDFTWGPPRAPKVTLVGKGVCFDTGGLDIKPSAAMLMMKKDMAGAATALALARMIMEAALPVRLRVLLPIVENAVSSASFRPGDVYRSRKGLTVEIGNTDAEGRLILADALALADEESPDLLFDFATLTGAARVALGPELPPYFCQDDEIAAAIEKHGAAVADPVWRLPLWPGYESMLASKIADTNNVSSGPFAGSITAALFLKKFVENARAWAHFDIYAWNPSTRPGRPEGGEAQTARLLYDFIETRYARTRKKA